MFPNNISCGDALKIMQKAFDESAQKQQHTSGLKNLKVVVQW